MGSRYTTEEYRKWNRERLRKWREANPDEAHKRDKKCRESNLEKDREKKKKSYAKHREQHREQHQEAERRYYSEHIEQCRERSRNYYKEHPEISANHLARRRALIGDKVITKEQWIAIMKQWNWHCAYCGEKLTEKTRTLDHVVPITKGGQHDPINLVAACRRCNSKKKEHKPSEWAQIPVGNNLWRILLIQLLNDVVYEFNSV